MLQETLQGWKLSLQNGVVRMIQIDFRLGLSISGGDSTAQLYVETPCTWLHHGMSNILDPADPSTLAPILVVVNKSVVDISITRFGECAVSFDDGRCLKVDYHDKYEAWQLGLSTGVLFVCPPGGAVALFRTPEAHK